MEIPRDSSALPKNNRTVKEWLSEYGPFAGFVAAGYGSGLFTGLALLQDDIHNFHWDRLGPMAAKVAISYGVRFVAFYSTAAGFYEISPDHGETLVMEKIRSQVEHIKKRRIRGFLEVVGEDVGIGINLGFRVLGRLNKLIPNSELELPAELCSFDHELRKLSHRRIIYNK